MEMLAQDIYDWCIKNDLWGDNCIYFNGKAWASWDEWSGEKGKKIGDMLYEYEDKNPKDYFEYANPDTLSMSFEGALNHVLNGYVHGWTKLEEEFSNLFQKYNVYYEMGHAWNLSAYEIHGVRVKDPVEKAIDYCNELIEKWDRNENISDIDICYLIEILKGRE